MMQLANLESKSFQRVHDLHDNLSNRDVIETESFPSQELSITPNGIIDTPLGEFKINWPAYRHILNDLSKIGTRTADHFEKINREDVLVYAINESFKASPNKVKLILRKDDCYGRVVISIPSDSYRFISDLDVLEYLTDKVDNKFSLDRATVSDDLFRVTFTQGEVYPKVGDLVKTGVEVVNSSSKLSRLGVSAATYRLVCSNGMTIQEPFFSRYWYHRGNSVLSEKLLQGIEQVYQNLLEVAPKLLSFTETPISEKLEDRVLGQLESRVGKRRSQKLMPRLDFSSNVYDLWNSITAIPHQVSNESLKMEMEALGGWVFTHV